MLVREITYLTQTNKIQYANIYASIKILIKLKQNIQNNHFLKVCFMINNFNIANKKVIIYGFGITGKWLSSNIKCDYFVDTDIKKCGNTFNNISVKRPDFLKQIKIDERLLIFLMLYRL